MLMLDLCCGLKGASAAFLDRGWDVVTVDINPVLKPDVLIDVREFTWSGQRPDLIWCSPRCNEFAREDNYPWKIFPKPDMSIYLACKRIISQVQPVYWVIENVRGAIPYFGPPVYSNRPFFLWGYFPALPKIGPCTKKESVSAGKELIGLLPYKERRALTRAVVPYRLSAALETVVRSQGLLF